MHTCIFFWFYYIRFWIKMNVEKLIVFYWKYKESSISQYIAICFSCIVTPLVLLSLVVRYSSAGICCLTNCRQYKKSWRIQIYVIPLWLQIEVWLKLHKALCPLATLHPPIIFTFEALAVSLKIIHLLFHVPLCPKSPSVRGFVASLPVPLSFKYV